MTARFGESFNPDQTSRVKVLDQENKVPEYVDFGRNIRSLLKGQDQETGEIKTAWPECPRGLMDLEDFFNSAKNAVAAEWQNASADLLQDKYQEWLGQIPDIEENQSIIRLLSNPQELDDKLKIQQLGEIEGLKNVLPEAWKTLVVASSERQLAVLTVLRHWLKNDLQAEDLAKLGSSREEMEILLDASGVTGKYIDHAYVKQIELAQEPGGTAATKWGGRAGAEYLYNLYKSPHNNDLETKSFSEVFAGEWPQIVNGLKFLSGKVVKYLANGKLPANYRGLPEFINHLITLYDSHEHSPKKINEIWRDLDVKINELAQAGCPIMFIPGDTVGVTGDANKVDIELRFGYRPPELNEFESSLEDFRQIAQGLVDRHQDKLDERYEVPKMLLNQQPLAFGSSLQYNTPAETGGERMVSHVSVNNELARVNHFPIIKKLFPERFKQLEEKEYLLASNLDTVLHETAHFVMSQDDEVVSQRTGGGTDGTLMDEVKAETVSMLLLQERLKTMDKAEADQLAEKQFYAKLFMVLDYLANKSSEKGTDGERYFYPGLAIVQRLMDKGILIEEQGEYKISDPVKGLEAIADLGQEVLDRFYLNEDSDRYQASRYAKELRAKKDDPRIRRLIDKMKS